MRRARVKVDGEAYYHVMSRCALQEHLLVGEVKGMFLRILRRAERFSGVRVLDYCIMDNHFHVLVKVPERQEVPDDELDGRIRVLYGEAKANRIFARWKLIREVGGDAAVERERNALRKRMYDLSEFMKTFKQRFSLWYCSNHGNFEGTIWQGPFHSVLVEGSRDALGAVSSYIALNPVRAGLVNDPGDYAWSGYGAACAGDAMAKSALVSAFGGKRSEAERWNAFRARIAADTAVCLAAREGEKEMASAKRATGQGNIPQHSKDTGNDPAVRQKTTGEAGVSPAHRDRDVSRGVAFGSESFVLAAISRASRATAIHTRPRQFIVSRGQPTLYCAGRRRMTRA